MYKLRSDQNTLWLGLFIPISTVTLSIKTIRCKVHSLMTEELDCAANKNWQSRTSELQVIKEKEKQKKSLIKRKGVTEGSFLHFGELLKKGDPGNWTDKEHIISEH